MSGLPLRFIYILIILTPDTLFAGNVRSISLGNARSTLLDEYAVFSNPAGICFNKGLFSIFSISNHYQIIALTEKELGLGYVHKNKGFGFSLNQLGDHRLSRTKISTAYSQRFGPALSLGIRINAIQWAFSDIYGSKILFSSTLSCVTNISKSLDLCCIIENPSRQFISKEFQERMESSISFGLLKKFSDRFSFRTEIEQKIQAQTNVKVSLEYGSGKSMIFRSGFESAYGRFSFGFESIFKKLSIDLAFSYEHTLGLKSSVGIIYRFDSSSN